MCPLWHSPAFQPCTKTWNKPISFLAEQPLSIHISQETWQSRSCSPFSGQGAVSGNVSSTGGDFPGRLCSLQPWRAPGPAQTMPWATWAGLEKTKSWTRNCLRSLSRWIFLWFHDKILQPQAGRGVEWRNISALPKTPLQLLIYLKATTAISYCGHRPANSRIFNFLKSILKNQALFWGGLRSSCCKEGDFDNQSQKLTFSISDKPENSKSSAQKKILLLHTGFRHKD